MSKRGFKSYIQLDAMDCGPTCLAMIFHSYGKNIELSEIRAKSNISKNGVSLENLENAASFYHVDSLPIETSFSKIKEEMPVPFIAHWRSNHFLVVYRITKKYVYISDPATGKIRITINEFLEGWEKKDDSRKGVCLLLEPTLEFHKIDDGTHTTKKFPIFQNYILPFKIQLYQILIGLLVVSVINISLPFFTQKIVDYGINYQDENFIYIVLMAQFLFFTIVTGINTIRNWIVLHMISRINFKMISDFLYKLFQLPISFYETKQLGDLMQRIQDHSKIDEFLAGYSLTSIFSSVNIIVFSGILFYFSPKIFYIFLIGTLLYFIWVLFFVKKRENINHLEFGAFSEQQGVLFSMLNNMQEIILNGSQDRKRKQWQKLELKAFHLNLRGLRIEEYQINGASFINEGKNIIIMIVASLAVLQSELSLGKLLAIQFIIAQMASPMRTLTTFISKYQDASISLKRLREIHNIQDNNKTGLDYIKDPFKISFENLYFKYPSSHREVLKNISLTFKKNTVSAIVGPSGSGKTTLIKLLLKFHPIVSGKIMVNDTNLNLINEDHWRSLISFVMQDGVVFNDTLENNITESVSNKPLDQEKLQTSLRAANLNGLVEELPNGVKTMIGINGQVLSGGEKQRVLLARALYKSSPILILDEATSSLDTENETTILERLKNIYQNKIVIIIAHRLSTIKKADQIIVVDNSEINEIGNHEYLLSQNGRYAQLINKQI